MTKQASCPFIVRYYYSRDKREYTKWFETQEAAENFVKGTQRSSLITTTWTSFRLSWEFDGNS